MVFVFSEFFDLFSVYGRRFTQRIISASPADALIPAYGSI